MAAVTRLSLLPHGVAASDVRVSPVAASGARKTKLVVVLMGVASAAVVGMVASGVGTGSAFGRIERAVDGSVDAVETAGDAVDSLEMDDCVFSERRDGCGTGVLVSGGGTGVVDDFGTSSVGGAGWAAAFASDGGCWTSAFEFSEGSDGGGWPAVSASPFDDSEDGAAG